VNAYRKAGFCRPFRHGARRARTADLLGAISMKTVAGLRRFSPVGSAVRFRRLSPAPAFATVCHPQLTRAWPRSSLHARLDAAPRPHFVSEGTEDDFLGEAPLGAVSPEILARLLLGHSPFRSFAPLFRLRASSRLAVATAAEPKSDEDARSLSLAPHRAPKPRGLSR
jgi:hypothetical protein